MNHKFTVIIPTRDRCKTLEFALRTCTAQQYENFEIIVSDNCSNDDTKAVVDSFRDSRIRYIKTSHRLSMSENFDFSLKHVEDGFLMFIGDDDGLFPTAIEQVNAIVNQYDVKAVLSSVSTYVWPNHADISKRGSFYWSPSNKVSIRQSSEWINKFLNFESIYTFDLPGLYMGFVHIDVVKQLTKDGYFFRSITPDAYSAFACAGVLKEYAYAERPFCIAGASASSNGASYFLQKEKKESEKFLQENTIQFHHKLRNCPSFKVIASEAFLQVQDAFPEYMGKYQLDIKKLLAVTLTEFRSDEVPSAMVKIAVKEIAEINQIDVSSLNLVSAKKRIRFIQFIKKIISSIPKQRKFVSIDDASKLGVWNIYDASIAGNVLMGLNEGYKVNRHFDLLKKHSLTNLKKLVPSHE